MVITCPDNRARMMTISSNGILRRPWGRPVRTGRPDDPRPLQALPADEGAAHSPPPFPTVLALDSTLPKRNPLGFFFGRRKAIADREAGHSGFASPDLQISGSPDLRISGKVGWPRDLRPGAPTDPDVRVSRIRLFVREIC